MRIEAVEERAERVPVSKTLEARRPLRAGDVEIHSGRSPIRRSGDDLHVRHQTRRVLL
jgi:hypothetical protein